MPLAQSQLEIAERPEVKALTQQASDMLASAEAFKVATVGDYEEAAITLKAVKSRQKDLKALKETLTKPMLSALEAARALFHLPESRLERSERLLKQAMSDYDQQQERLRQEAQRKLDEAAERERRQLAQRAERAAAKGDHDKAGALAERAAMTVAPIAQPDRPAVAGISRRETWHAEVTDVRALVRGVADGHVPLAAIQPNKTFLNGQARALRAELRYPGVRAVPERTIASGSA
jgi:hypothetical protein